MVGQGEGGNSGYLSDVRHLRCAYNLSPPFRNGKDAPCKGDREARGLIFEIECSFGSCAPSITFAIPFLYVFKLNHPGDGLTCKAAAGRASWIG